MCSLFWVCEEPQPDPFTLRRRLSPASQARQHVVAAAAATLKWLATEVSLTYIGMWRTLRGGTASRECTVEQCQEPSWPQKTAVTRLCARSRCIAQLPLGALATESYNFLLPAPRTCELQGEDRICMALPALFPRTRSPEYQSSRGIISERPSLLPRRHSSVLIVLPSCNHSLPTSTRGEESM